MLLNLFTDLTSNPGNPFTREGLQCDKRLPHLIIYIPSDKIETNSKSFSLNFNGVRFNTLNHLDLSGEIDKEVQLGQNNIPSKKSYLNGNGYFSTIKLFDKQDSQNELLNDLRKNRWLVSEANLFLYVDQDHYVSSEDLIERLYLFNYSNGLPVIDFTLDNSVNNNQKNRDKFIFGGFLEYDDLERPYRYKFRITNHVNRLIRKDSTNYTTLSYTHLTLPTSDLV